MAIVAKKLQKVKTDSIQNLKGVFEAGSDYIFAEYRGMTVEKITALRKQLRAKGAQFKVVKNNFARIAFQELGISSVSQYLTGPTAVAIASKDPNEVTKLLFDFAKEEQMLKIKGGLIGTIPYDVEQIEAFSKLPGRLELIAMLMSVMNGPIRNVTVALNDIPGRLVRTLKAIADKAS
ncbi:MAG: 50S ribosomal protein L10 [Treponema sp.]|jgi:large subunit ribosomal protein L10|nr:50S ribosomal protein L10 [Treponema sp.]